MDKKTDNNGNGWKNYIIYGLWTLLLLGLSAYNINNSSAASQNNIELKEMKENLSSDIMTIKSDLSAVKASFETITAVRNSQYSQILYTIEQLDRKLDEHEKTARR